MEDFYVYIYFRIDGRPCYVGKGSGERWLRHLNRETNRHLRNIIRQAGGDLPRTKVRENLSEAHAFDLEIALIAEIGREAHGGPLVNLTDGGEGPSGMIFSEETRAKISAAGIGNKYALGGPKDIAVRARANEIRSAASREFWSSDELRRQQSAASLARWQDPVWRSAQMARFDEVAKRPEIRDARIAFLEAYRESMTEAQREQHAETSRKNATAQWAKPETRETIMSGIVAAWDGNDDGKANAASKARSSWADFAIREKRILALREGQKRRRARERGETT